MRAFTVKNHLVYYSVMHHRHYAALRYFLSTPPSRLGGGRRGETIFFRTGITSSPPPRATIFISVRRVSVRIHVSDDPAEFRVTYTIFISSPPPSNSKWVPPCAHVNLLIVSCFRVPTDECFAINLPYLIKLSRRPYFASSSAIFRNLIGKI